MAERKKRNQTKRNLREMEREREDIIQTRDRDRQKGGGGERKRKVEGRAIIQHVYERC